MNLAMEHTQLTTYLEIGRRGGGGGKMRRDEGAEGGRCSKGAHKCVSVFTN